MSGIFGIVQRTGAPLAPSTLDRMCRSMAGWAPDGSALWHDGRAGLGQARMFSTPECHHNRLPRVDKASGIGFTAAARVDNRAELGRLLNISLPEQTELPDTEFLFRAYLRWGEHCPAHVYGDWAFAAWHPRERKLFLARDHFGNTSLFFHADPQVLAFASSRQALLDLSLAPAELDELYLAQVLIAWTACHGERTIHRSIRRLPPAHALTVTADRMNLRPYWRLEDTPELSLPRRSDHVSAFTEIFDDAVGARLRTSDAGTKAGIVAVTLSGGLDSGAVTATAARLLGGSGQRLAAFTSVPLSDPRNYVGGRFGDELPLATATAQSAGNVDLHAVSAARMSPVQAIRRMLQITHEPGHAAGNFYWILELERSARALGCRVLLTGQMGNGGVSWTGDLSSQSFAFQIRRLGLQAWIRARLIRVKEHVKRSAPPGWLTEWQRRRMEQSSWHRATAIHPDFARRLHLLEQRLNDPNEQPAASPREMRYRALLPGRSFGGALHAEMGAAHGLEIRDPTADARVLAFTLSVPDHIFIDPETGLDRWLIREAMKGLLPDAVRLNRGRGRQAGDLVPRLRACASEVEIVLDELTRGSAASYVDVAYMRAVWRMIQTENTPEAFKKSVTVLTRGIMAGLFVNQFEESSVPANREPIAEVLACGLGAAS